MSFALRSLFANRAETSSDALDPALRGRTYTIPFDGVWSALIALADGGLRGWRVVRADASPGRIEAEAESRIRRRVDDVTIRVGLDPAGWTRVDVTSSSRSGGMDWGANRRRVRDLLRRLDARLAADGARTGASRPTGVQL